MLAMKSSCDVWKVQATRVEFPGFLLLWIFTNKDEIISIFPKVK
jgi:hypothetical protein